jgi:hypothetical protein
MLDLFLSFGSHSDLNLKFTGVLKIISEMSSLNIFAQLPLLNVLLWNIRCLSRKKFTNLQQYLDEMTRNSKHEPGVELNRTIKQNFMDFIILTETWSPENAKFNTFTLKNFNLFSVSRPTNQKGGGIFIYSHKKYHAIEVDKLVSDDLEYLLIKIIVNKSEWHVLGIYRRPQGNLHNFLEIFEEIISGLDVNKLIIGGDFNINLRDEHSSQTNAYTDSLLSLNLCAANKTETRVNNLFDNSGSLIDHFLVSKHHTHLSLTSTRFTNMSDHNFILLFLKTENACNRKLKSQITIVDEKKAIDDANWALFNTIFDPSTEDVNLYFEEIHDSVQLAVTTHSRKKTIKLLKDEAFLPAWANFHYTDMLHVLHNLMDKIERLKRKGNDCDRLESKYKELDELRVNYGSLIAKSYYKEISIKSAKQGWKIINELSGRARDHSAIIIKDSNGNFIFDSQEIAHAFQEKFISIVGAKPSRHVIRNHIYLGICGEISFVFDEITPYSIFVTIGSLNNKKSTGYDGISNNVWKGVSELACVHLCNIFNNMLRSGIYPSRLKKAVVVPIFKGGDAFELSNYRPISILPSVDKIFEKILYEQINSRLESNNIHDPLQYGFRNGRGCQEAIAMLLHQVSVEINCKKSVLVVSFDIAKAFDSVNISILMRKLYLLGFRGRSFDLIESFLSGRSQQVKYDNKMSEEGRIHRGVPQGSNLGPLLFNIMLNDMKNLPTHGKLIKYADDLIYTLPLEIVKSEPRVNAIKLSRDLKRIAHYYHMNDLNLNCDKSKYIVCGGGSDQEVELTLHEYSITRCETLTYLGFVLDTRLRLDSNVDKIAKVIACGLNALMHMKSNLTRDALLQFYHAHIGSHIQYCAFALLRATVSDIERLQRLQNKAFKIIYSLPKLFPTIELFTKNASDSLTVIGHIYYSAVCLAKKASLSSDGSLPQVTKFRAAARNSNLLLARASKDVLKMDITHTGLKLFNQLPEEIKSADDLSVFKAKAKIFILQHTESLLKSGQLTSHRFDL